MECQYAYLKENIDYVLCKREPEPTRYDKTELFHAVCPHQEHCPRENCHKLTAGWLTCAKRPQTTQNAPQATFAKSATVSAPAAKKPTRSRKKPQAED